MLSGKYRGMAWLAFILAMWFLLFRQVCGYWSVQPQYDYGWFVPLLGGYAWWSRWQTRPEPTAGGKPGLAKAALVTLLILLGLVRLVQEANRDWQLVSWSLALLTVGTTLVGVWWCGGTPWLRHFWFVTLFPLVSVPWPSSVEQPVILGMTRIVAAFASEVLTISGMPAIQEGNTIHLSQGPVGVEEACSGIQSLQSSIMMSLFLGEIFAFPTVMRAALFSGAIGWSFLCNLARTTYLGTAMYHGGKPGVDRVHDTAGYVAMAAGYAGVVLLALWMSRGLPLPKPKAPEGRPRLIPISWCAACLAWLLGSEFATEWWYSRTEQSRNPTTNPTWAVKLGSELKGARPVDPPSAVRVVLRYDEGNFFEWTSPEGYLWTINAMRWEPGNLAADNAGHHNPAVCLVTAGFKLKDEYEMRTFRMGKLDVPFRTFRFEDKGRQLLSFYCSWDQRNGFRDAKAPEAGGWTSAARLRNVLAGRRTAGLQVLTVFVEGPIPRDKAYLQFQQILNQVTSAKSG